MGEAAGSGLGQAAMNALFMHTVVYVAVNGLLVACWVLFGEGTTEQAAASFRSLDEARQVGFWPLYVIVFWGAGLLIHAGATLSYRLSSHKRRKARERKRREAQARLVGAVDGTILADAALAGISYVDGEKAARKVKRKARGVAKGGTRTKADKPKKNSGGGTVHPRPTAPEVTQLPTPSPTLTPRGEPASSPAGTGEAGRQWTAVMFTDIDDSTPLTEALGDDAWARLLVEHRQMVRRCVRDHGGHEVGTQGDGFLIRFDDPDAAVRCAMALQRHLAELQDGEGVVPSVRIGIHAGEVVHAAHEDDLVGRVINLAARVTDVAGPGEILVTEPVADHLTIDVKLVDRGLAQLKGFDRPRHLLAVVWRAGADHIVLEPARDVDERVD